MAQILLGFQVRITAEVVQFGSHQGGVTDTRVLPNIDTQLTASEWLRVVHGSHRWLWCILNEARVLLLNLHCKHGI